MLIKAAIVLATVFAGVLGECPDGFVHHDLSCYKVFHIRGTWSEARGYCSIFNAQIVAIESQRESHFLTGLLERDGAAAYDPGRFWLGATDLITEGEWVWAANNQAVDSSLAQWAPGEPSNTNHAEHCLALDFHQNLLWTDEDCELKNNFICEVENRNSGIIG